MQTKLSRYPLQYPLQSANGEGKVGGKTAASIPEAGSPSPNNFPEEVKASAIDAPRLHFCILSGFWAVTKKEVGFDVSLPPVCSSACSFV